MKAIRPGTRNKRARDAGFELPRDLVPHPRAREMARRAHGRPAEMSVEEIRAEAWPSGGSTIVPGTAVRANTALQNYPMFPRHVHADLLKQCRTCARPFVFYANEQRFWYETLHIPVDADCVNCPPCRKRMHRLKGCQLRYTAALHAPRLDTKAMKTFVDDTLHLFEQGRLREFARVGAIKNRALREIGDYAGTQRLVQALAQAREAAEMRPGAWRSRRWAA